MVNLAHSSQLTGSRLRICKCHRQQRTSCQWQRRYKPVRCRFPAAPIPAGCSLSGSGSGSIAVTNKSLLPVQGHASLHGLAQAMSAKHGGNTPLQALTGSLDRRLAHVLCTTSSQQCKQSLPCGPCALPLCSVAARGRFESFQRQEIEMQPIVAGGRPPTGPTLPRLGRHATVASQVDTTTST